MAVETHYNLGNTFLSQGRAEVALFHYRSASVGYQEAGNSDRHVVSLLHEARSAGALGLHRYERESIQKVIQKIPSITDPLIVGEVFNGLGTYYVDNGNALRSIELFRAAVDIFGSQSELRGVGIAFSNLSGVFLTTGQYRDSADLFMRVFENQEFPIDVRMFASNGLGTAMYYMREYELSNRFFEMGGSEIGQAISLAHITADSEPLLSILQESYEHAVAADVYDEVFDSAVAIAEIYRINGRYEDAIPWYRTAIAHSDDFQLQRLDSTGTMAGTTARRLGIFDDRGPFEGIIESLARLQKWEEIIDAIESFRSKEVTSRQVV